MGGIGIFLALGFSFCIVIGLFYRHGGSGQLLVVFRLGIAFFTIALLIPMGGVGRLFVLGHLGMLQGLPRGWFRPCGHGDLDQLCGRFLCVGPGGVFPDTPMLLGFGLGRGGRGGIWRRRRI